MIFIYFISSVCSIAGVVVVAIFVVAFNLSSSFFFILWMISQVPASEKRMLCVCIAYVPGGTHAQFDKATYNAREW